MTPLEARALLSVGPQATRDEVRAAFRAQIGRHHPDVNPAPGTSARAIALIEALVEFVDGPVVTLTLSLQGRVAAGTEVFISMEPWSRPPRPDLPDPDAVARLLSHHLCEAAAELGPPLTD